MSDSNMSSFRCKKRRKTLGMFECIDDFTDAHAFTKRDKRCYGCEVGAKHRYILAFGETPTEAQLERYLKYCGFGPRIGRPHSTTNPQ